MYLKLFTISIIAILFSSSLNAQNVKGKASAMRSLDASEAEATIKYGNVEAYDKKGKLVASVLTDELGNYTINFKDTGTYEIHVMYSGYEDIKETIHVKGDEISDFSLKRDKAEKIRMAPVGLIEESDGYAEYSKTYFSSARTVSAKDVGGSYGKTITNSSRKSSKIGKGLTAGEINDFAKWDLWNDVVAKELEMHQKNWKLNPHQRYVVQLMNNQKSPLVGAEVKLISRGNKTLWQALTDNTGKAELWGSLDGTDVDVKNITIDHNGTKGKIDSPTVAKNGINSLRMDVECDTKNIVDVAFVIDATGSMGDEINFIKSDLNTVIYNSQNIYQDVALRYASVFYRDKTDSYLTKKKDFTNVLSEALVFIDEQSAGGGGDTPEAVDMGLEVAINELSWSEDARSRILFLVLDAKAHNDSASVHRILNMAEEAAKKGIKIIPVAASGIDKSGEYLMRALALCTNGKYVFLTNHSGIGNSHIEPSTDEYEVELLSERLTDIIKNNMFYPECEQDVPDLALNYPDSLVQFPYQNRPDLTMLSDSLRAIIDRLIKDTLIVDNQTLDSLQLEQNRIDSLLAIVPEVTIEWKFYPNPTQDIVNIEASEKVEMIYLTDLSGKLLQEISMIDSRRTQISLAQYPAGIYLLRYPMGKQWVTGKIILARS